MLKHQNLIYALKEGEIISIADVERGLKCGCVCPACGEPLVAKKGSKVAHHFAHLAGKNCEYGYQTSLHLAAKDILSKAKKMVVPAVVIEFPDTYKRELVSEEKEIPIDRVELERRFDGVIPDVVIYSGNKYFFVEIFVTHRVDEEKLAKLKKANISTVEVDLSDLDQMITSEELKDILLQDNGLKQWIYNATIPKWLDKFKKIADKRIIKEGFIYRVYNCPIQKRIWGGRVYANVSDDCWHCCYHIADKGEYILCSGREQIAHVKDFSVPQKVRFKQRENLVEKKQSETRKTRYCPLCGALMIERWGRYGPFWGCSRYPDCQETISVVE